jgi:acetyl-CoA carboxylase biotin carboxylase subunit
MFKKILIANRGEIALRVIRTCKEMGIKTVAVYSTADKDSLHVRFADESYCIGPHPSKSSYLNITNILTTAKISKADAIHPGYGFLAENADFSRLCAENNIKFIGPTPEQISAMGDKITAKETMINAGVPVVPGSKGLISDIIEGKNQANIIGYPVILKATAGGGGKGMRIIWDESEFESNYNNAKAEAANSFANDGVYLEKFIEEPRHIEVQIIGDQYGNVAHLSERDCSIQRRHQKLIEESPSPFVDVEFRDKLGAAARKAAQCINYEGLGTIEFLVDKYKNFYFMEMNTRIQVEHPVTEEVTGIDLVRFQIEVAAGKALEQSAYYPKGHSIECRINAENPLKNFAPNPGKITFMHTPNGFGVRTDTHVASGSIISPFYDSMIAKLIVKGTDRQNAIDKMKRALDEFIIEGIETTIPFHKVMMREEAFVTGNFNTKFLESFDFDKLSKED